MKAQNVKLAKEYNSEAGSLQSISLNNEKVDQSIKEWRVQGQGEIEMLASQECHCIAS